MTMCLITAASQAQSEGLVLHFRVPVAFSVENTSFAAGEYQITEPAHMILELRNVKSQAASFHQVLPARSRKEADGRARLVFHRYGKEYFLAVVSDGSSSPTFDYPESKEEKRVADTTPGPQMKLVTFLSDGSVPAVRPGQK